ncbi:UDP-2,3-diacylglucosamine diphosphatase [Ekhidna sp.]|uniref:UDP-2,3-diacylglucosamine diphosphatase n=1 Tax=Ekhidna sp. TaxID=2608089 RepID=UPI003B500DAF
MKVHPELISSYKELPSDKKVYFASDFHLGIPNKEESLKREKKIAKWLEYVSKDASAIFLLGDIFDFWFEYKTVVPKGFLRFQGKLAELRDRGIPIHIFTGNHDLWMKDYFSSELDIQIHNNLVRLDIQNKLFLIGHGDGLGPGDQTFKVLKKVFINPLSKWLYKWIHPDIGVSIAQYWSKKSRLSSGAFNEKCEEEENEQLLTFCKKMDQKLHHDYYVFGHRHLPLELTVNKNSTYYNLGEWVSQCNYLAFDGEKATLEVFKD